MTELLLRFTDEAVPQIKRGSYDYFFVRCRSNHDGKIRVFGAYYLNAYPLHYEYGCIGCEGVGGDNCPMANGDGCPTTGWFDEVANESEDHFYERIYGEVIGFAEQPAPALDTDQ